MLDDSQEFYYVDGLSADSTVNFIAIPETYNGLPVTEIGYDAFNGCSSLETVSIPSSISVVQSGAFEGCRNLSDIAFSEDITIISSETFKNCINLTNFTIPSSVTEIGNRAFENSGLVEIDIPENVETMAANVFLDCNNLADIYLHWAEGEKPSGWNMNWNNGVPANVTIHYAGNQGGEDPDEPGTIDKADIYDALSYVVNTATTYAVMPSLLPGLSKNPNDSTAMEYTLNYLELFFIHSLAASVSRYCCFGCLG